MPQCRDPRWILLTENGEYTTLGRHREPDAEDISSLEVALEKAGISGWLAIMSHSANATTQPELIMVRPLRQPKTVFADALQAFRRRIG